MLKIALKAQGSKKILAATENCWGGKMNLAQRWFCVKIYSIVLKSPKDCEHTGAWTMWRISCRRHFDCIFTNYFEDAIKSVDGFLSNGRQAIITSRGKASSWTSDDLIRQSIYSPQGPNEFNTLWPCYNVWRRRNGPSLVSHCTDQYWLNFNFPLTKTSVKFE